MATSKTIDRRVTVSGQTLHVRAANEQEYVEKLLEAFGTFVSAVQGENLVKPKRKHRFHTYAENWYTVFSKPNVSTVTAVAYKRQLELYWYPAFRDKGIEDITPEDIQTAFNNMGELARATKMKARIVLNQIMEHAVDEGIIEKNPLLSRSIRITGHASQTTPVYSVEDMQYFVQHIREVERPMDRAYFALQIMHPLRLEEVLGLKHEDLDRQNGILHVRRAVVHPNRNLPEVKETKTECSRRDIAFAMSVLDCIPTGKPQDFILGGGKPLSYTEVRNMCSRIARNIGYKGSISPIRFRTTVLTDIYAETKDIKMTQLAAGHTTAAMTLKHYVKARDQAGENTATVVEGLYGARKTEE